MAKIGPVKLKIDVQGAQATLDVAYDIEFSAHDRQSQQAYKEECRLIGDDTNVGDPPAAGGDDTLGFLTPPFFDDTKAGDSPTLARHWTKTVRKNDLDEDRGAFSDSDELRARVTLTPVPPATGKAVHRESNLVRKNI
jgi:hypothetical protein